jgi:RimJ/RimL family protein N-acetyltransferase
MAEIRTQRLLLRRARAADLEDMHAVLSDSRAMRFWSTLPHTTLGQTGEWLDRMISASPAESDDFVVEHEGRVIGKAGCWRLPEIGFILHPDHWGQGLAREALAAVIEHVFERRAIQEITADVDPRNEASLRLLRRLGFGKTGTASRTYFTGGEWCDSVYLALRRPQIRNTSPA